MRVTFYKKNQATSVGTSRNILRRYLIGPPRAIPVKKKRNHPISTHVINWRISHSCVPSPAQSAPPPPRSGRAAGPPQNTPPFPLKPQRFSHSPPPHKASSSPSYPPNPLPPTSAAAGPSIHTSQTHPSPSRTG